MPFRTTPDHDLRPASPGRRRLMGAFVAPRWISILGWVATAMVVSASLWKEEKCK
jgi:hypothetical protein